MPQRGSFKPSGDSVGQGSGSTSTVYNANRVLPTSTDDIAGQCKEYFEDLLNISGTFSIEQAESGGRGV